MGDPVERVKERTDSGAESGSDSPLISRRPMTPGRERERKKIGGHSPNSSPSFSHPDMMANASPKMFHQGRGQARGGSPQLGMNSAYDKSLGGAGIGREVKDIYDSSSGEEISDDDDKKQAK